MMVKRLYLLCKETNANQGLGDWGLHAQNCRYRSDT